MNSQLTAKQAEHLRRVLRENDMPFFTDADLAFYFAKNKGDLDATIRECALAKAENTEVVVSGLTIPDNSGYFRRLAARYRPSKSGVLKGGF